MSIDDLFTLLPSLFEFICYIVVYPFTLLFNAALSIYASMSIFISSTFTAFCNVAIDIFNIFAWLPVPVKVVFTIEIGLLVTLLVLRVIGRVVQVFYPSGVGD